ncbi:MAG: hypothetical protein HYX74_06930 [Acidobacteria bacterium]|nr:hypothetical protein [Acidobacteriota bacterium]
MRRLGAVGGAGAGPRRAGYLWHVVPLAAVLLVIWTPPRLLTQDGPSHLYTSILLGRLLTGTETGGCFGIVKPPPPDSLTAWTGLFLVPLLGTAVTEKVWATLYLFMLAGGALCLGRRIEPHNSGVGVYLLVLNPYFFAGFWNFNLGIGLLLLAAASVLRLLERPSPRRVAATALLAVVLYFTHLFVFAALLLVWSMLLLAEGRSAARKGAMRPEPAWGSERPPGRKYLRYYLLSAGLVLAGTVAVGWQMRVLEVTSGAAGLAASPGEFQIMVLSDVNVWYRYGEQTLMPWVQLAVLSIACWRGTRRGLPFRYPLMCLLLLGLFVMVPDHLGAAMALKGRFWLLAVLLAALCLPARRVAVVGALSTALVLWHAAETLPRQLQWNRQVNALLRVAPKLERNQSQASLMGVYWGRSEQPRGVLPLLHTDLLLAAESGGWSLSSNQLQSRGFPLRYLDRCAAAADSMTDLLLREVASPELIAARLEAVPVRYVVIWKSGRLPWLDLKRRWRVVGETADFLVLETA